METLSGQQETMKSEDAVTRRVIIEAKRTYESVADEEFLEQCAMHAVKELWQDSIKVTTFVPVLAMRRVRESVDQQKGEIAGAGRLDG